MGELEPTFEDVFKESDLYIESVMGQAKNAILKKVAADVKEAAGKSLGTSWASQVKGDVETYVAALVEEVLPELPRCVRECVDSMLEDEEEGAGRSGRRSRSASPARSCPPGGGGASGTTPAAPWIPPADTPEMIRRFAALRGDGWFPRAPPSTSTSSAGPWSGNPPAHSTPLYSGAAPPGALYYNQTPTPPPPDSSFSYSWSGNPPPGPPSGLSSTFGSPDLSWTRNPPPPPTPGSGSSPSYSWSKNPPPPPSPGYSTSGSGSSCYPATPFGHNNTVAWSGNPPAHSTPNSAAGNSWEHYNLTPPPPDSSYYSNPTQNSSSFGNPQAHSTPNSDGQRSQQEGVGQRRGPAGPGAANSTGFVEMSSGSSG